MLAVTSATVAALKQKFTPEQAAQAAKDMAIIGTGKLTFLKEVEACKILIYSNAADPLRARNPVFRLGAIWPS